MKKIKVAHHLKQWWISFEQYPKLCWGFSILGLFLICSLAFVWNLGDTGLVDETEPLFAEAARQMNLTKDWITPYFNGETRFDKPPLVYWLMALGYQLFGVNEWAVRFPSALAAIGLTVACFVTLRYFGFAPFSTSNSRKRSRQLWLSAWVGTAIAAFNLETLVWARQGVSDMLLSGLMGTALLCFFWGYLQGEVNKNRLKSFNFIPNTGYLGFYILMGLAVLTKGPVGVVLPVLIITTFLIYIGNFWQVLREMKVFFGGIIFVAITLPWYILVILKNGQAYLNSFFGYHNFERFTSVVNGHSAPWYFYFPVVLIGFMPWSIYLPLAIVRLRFWNRSLWCQQPRSNQLGLFALFWFCNILIFFSISVTKLPSYVLPLMPAAALLVALFWSDELTRYTSQIKLQNHQGLLFSGVTNVFFLILLATACIYAPQFVSNDPAIINFPEVVEKSDLPIRGGIIWGATAIFIAFLLRHKSHWRWIIVANFAGFISFFIFLVNPAIFLLDEVRQLPLRQLSQKVSEVEQPQEELLMIGFRKPSVVFYSQRSVQFFKIRDMFKLEEGSPLYYIYDSIQNRPIPSTFLVISRLQDLERIGLKPQDYEMIEKNGRYVLVRLDKKIIIDRVLKQN